MRDLKATLAGILFASVAACKTPTATSTQKPVGGEKNWQANAQGESLDCPAMQSLDDIYRELPWDRRKGVVSFFSVMKDEDKQANHVPPVAKMGYIYGPACKACEVVRGNVADAYAPDAARGQGWVHLWAAQHQVKAYGFAVVSRNGVEAVVATVAGLREFLEPLTTVKHAQAWAVLESMGLGCRVDATKDIAVGETWFDLRTQNTQCIDDANGKAFDVTYDVVYRVHSNATVETLPPREVARQPSVDGCVMVGRRPVAMTENRPLPAEFAALLAETAALEAAAVIAFDELGRSLRQFGAPAELIARAQTAKADEVRHTALMATHAANYGWDAALPVAAAPAATAYASLFDLALHNAREGCVNETYGALVALHQAQAAVDLDVRASLAQIADDEVRHAQWSHDLDAWLQPLLSTTQQQAVAAAKATALAELASLAQAPTSEAQIRMGLPGADVAAQFVARLRTATA